MPTHITVRFTDTHHGAVGEGVPRKTLHEVVSPYYSDTLVYGVLHRAAPGSVMTVEEPEGRVRTWTRIG